PCCARGSQGPRASSVACQLSPSRTNTVDGRLSVMVSLLCGLSCAAPTGLHNALRWAPKILGRTCVVGVRFLPHEDEGQPFRGSSQEKAAPVTRAPHLAGAAGRLCSAFGGTRLHGNHHPGTGRGGRHRPWQLLRILRQQGRPCARVSAPSFESAADGGAR